LRAPPPNRHSPRLWITNSTLPAGWRSQIVIDTRGPERRYIPGHPDADANGYVAFPRVNPAEDMVDLMDASRGYEANVAAITAAKDMIQRSIDLLR